MTDLETVTNSSAHILKLLSDRTGLATSLGRACRNLNIRIPLPLQKRGKKPMCAAPELCRARNRKLCIYSERRKQEADQLSNDAHMMNFEGGETNILIKKESCTTS